MISPFRCNPVYHKKVWGGRWFEEVLGRNLPDGDPYGESWELSCRTDAMSIIQNGPFRGKALQQLLAEKPLELLGERVLQKAINPFPLLIKFLDANDHLSVQVHPDDQYAQQCQLGDQGKHEMWYILDAEPDASIILGLRTGTTQEKLIECIKTRRIFDCFNQILVNVGDAFFIPAGTVHAILKGIRLVEIQQNSDVTFRIYDWERPGLDGKPRQLNIDDALQVINYNLGEIKSVSGLVFQEDGYVRRLLVTCPCFGVEELVIEYWKSQVLGECFEVWTVLEGNACLQLDAEQHGLQKGQTWFIPATMGKFAIQGRVKILRTYIPDI